MKILSGKGTIGAVAEAMKLNESVLGRWKRDYERGGDAGLEPKAPGRRKLVGPTRTPAGPTRALAVFDVDRRQPMLTGRAEVVPAGEATTPLYAALGRLTVENQTLRAENQALRQQLAKRR